MAGAPWFREGFCYNSGGRARTFRAVVADMSHPASQPDSVGHASRASTVVASAVVAGALAGACTGLSDFGAAWLWLPMASDRLALLVRLVAIEAPLGALVGLLLGLLHVAVERVLERRAPSHMARLWPLPFVVLLSPGLVHVARLLFTGGSMSRLPARGVLAAAVFLAMAIAVYVALAIGRRVVLDARAATGRGRALRAAFLFVSFFACGKLNQHVLPNLYEYLHTALSVSGFALAFAFVLSGLPSLTARMPRLVRPIPAVVALGASLLALAANLWSLEDNQNVRVVLHDVRAVHSRSLMRTLSPALRVLVDRNLARSAAVRTRSARMNRRTAWNGPPLPTVANAHVLLVTIDALRADHLGAYGYQRGLTPNLDALARRSVVFERAYAAAPHSSYSLCSLMTSEYVHEVVDLRLPLPEATLASVTRDAGYHTAAFYTLGIFHTEGERLRPYEEGTFHFARHEHTNHPAEERTDVALGEIDRILERGEPPSLLWTHYFDVHEPYRDTSLGTSDLDRYDGEIRNVDRALGRLLREADRRLERPIIVVITADHGEEFRDHGGVYHGSTLYEEQIRVPLIVHVPGMPARRIREPVELVDVAPTLLGLVDLSPAPTMRGRDLRPYMMGYARREEPAFAAVAHKRMVVAYPHKLIADLRFDVYEVYDLEADPHERRNLAGTDPALLERLRTDVYAWLDGFRAKADETSDPRIQALDRGRLGDRRAVGPLGELVQDEEASTQLRVEAARLLGRLTDERAFPSLRRAQESTDRRVAAEAAIALGRLYEPHARGPLRALVRSEDVEIRVRAGISLARLGDAAAVPALLETLRVSRDQAEREEAVRWIGRLGDADASETLIELLADYRIRHLSVIALGRLHDPRAFDPLVEMLAWEHHSNIRNNVTRALGELGDERAIAPLVAVAAREPDLNFPSESLVRLGALGRGAIGGADFGPDARRVPGLARCTAGPLDEEWRYIGRTYCALDAPRVSMPLVVPTAVAEARGGVVVLVRARVQAGAPPTKLHVTIDGERFPEIDLDTHLREFRFTLPAGRLPAGHTSAVLELVEPGARVDVDHVLLIPAGLDG